MDLEVAKPTWCLQESSQGEYIVAQSSESTQEENGDTEDGLKMEAMKSWTSSCQSSEEARAMRRALLSVRGEDSNWMLRRRDLQLKQELGRTLKSTVYLASWQGADVVVKRALDAGQTEEATALEITDELLHEIDVLSSMRHPDLVMFIGASLEPQRPIMCVMEFMPGGDLERYFAAQRNVRGKSHWRPSLAKVIEWSCAVARALSFLHGRKMVHRDLKPMNLLLTKHNEVKVSDFGISRMLTQVDDYNMTGGIGTLRYMAPEVVRHESYDEKVDIYAFGLIMYFMSSGFAPFHNMGEPRRICSEFVKGREPRPSATDCSPPLRPIMEAAWHADASRRPTAPELLEELSRVPQKKLGGCGPCAQM